MLHFNLLQLDIREIWYFWQFMQFKGAFWLFLAPIGEENVVAHLTPNVVANVVWRQVVTILS